MFVACLILGAIAGICFQDRRALSAVLVGSGLLLLSAVLMQKPLIWLAATILCFQASLLVAGLITIQIRPMLGKKEEPRPRPRRLP